MACPAELLLTELTDWVEAGALRPFDLSLTRFIHRRAPELDPAVLLAIALTSARNGHGHVCLDLTQALSHPDSLLARLRDDRDPHFVIRQSLRRQLAPLTPTAWVERLAASAAVTRAQQAHTDTAPLVLDRREDRSLLYLRRYWQYEQVILQHIHQRLTDPPALDETHLSAALDTLFPDSGIDFDWQKLACALATRRRFFILTGGPGTGKTTTVVRLLALLQRLAVAAGDPPPRMELAAPTGKAAARLNESIRGQIDSLPGTPADNAVLPRQVKTLHRLLGPRPDSRRFRHHAGEPLP
ncbi:MAG: AAA family ATPase, partial [Thioalkalivibrio sp.]